MSFISTVYVPSDNALTKLYCTAIVNGIKLKCPYMLLIEKLKHFAIMKAFPRMNILEVYVNIQTDTHKPQTHTGDNTSI